VYPNRTTFTYSIGLRVSSAGVEPDIRINDKPFDAIPETPILDWTQDEIRAVFFRGYQNWQPKASLKRP